MGLKWRWFRQTIGRMRGAVLAINRCGKSGNRIQQTARLGSRVKVTVDLAGEGVNPHLNKGNGGVAEAATTGG
ncbi:UNVERIFIED_CONTAM: hypothetical protein Sradi_1500500 [Sesamum radiatum]|uniref:Uncharacterized protein n=1 Tax=Sesamum radiatum TaxID=300843 RepID=A0AAW2U805_SESRA